MYAKTGNRTTDGYVYEENQKHKLDENPLPFPILQREMIATAMGTDKRVFKTLFPTYQESRITEPNTDSVAFCIVLERKMAKDYVGILEEMLWEPMKEMPDLHHLSIGFIFYGGDDETASITPPKNPGDALEIMRKEALQVTGKGGSPSPTLDAIALAVDHFNWRIGATQAPRKICILVTGADIEPRTIGLGEVHRDLGVSDIISRLKSNGITVYTHQAGSVTTQALIDIALETNGDFYSEGSAMEPSLVKHFIEPDSWVPGDLTSNPRSLFPKRVLPLEAIGWDVIARYQNRIGKDPGGLLLEDGWMFESSDLYERILVDKALVTHLIRLFDLLADPSLELKEQRLRLKESVEAMTGEELAVDAELQVHIEQSLGIQFSTSVLSWPLDDLLPLTARERQVIVKYLPTVSGKLNSFLEVNADCFKKNKYCWMPSSYLP